LRTKIKIKSGKACNSKNDPKTFMSVIFTINDYYSIAVLLDYLELRNIKL